MMMGLSHTAVANGELASALIVGLQLSGPAGSITAGAPGVGSGPAVSGARTGRPTGIGRVGTMTHTILVLAGVLMLLGVGVLIGSGLHTGSSIDREYRRLAQRVRHLNGERRHWTGGIAPPGSAGPRGVDADLEWPVGSVTASAVCSLHTTMPGRSTYAPSCG